ncbi:MLO-like protein 11, partial [Cucurbita argyrosperma subsp. argyrosperma]
MAENGSPEGRSLALTPTWSVASVLTIFVAISLLVERSIHRLSSWLEKSHRKPLFEALEKMKEELMLLGFISLLLTASSSVISNICIPSKFYDTSFTPCSQSQIDEHHVDTSSEQRKLYMVSSFPHLYRRMLTIHSWRVWENEAHMDLHDVFSDTTKEKIMQRQSHFVQYLTSNPLTRSNFLIWMTCFFRQFGSSVVHSDYLTLRKGFITNHNLSSSYDFHSYMVRSMEEEFQRIVGVSGPLWGFVVAFLLFNVKGSNLYFWIASIPFTLVLLVGTKLQHVIATLTLENAGISGFFSGAKLKPRDDLFWFKKPEFLLSLIHFVLFQACLDY